uniref:Serine protease inhibitor n=1 Tax=Moniliophthora roreri TaxID=221103 RepID=A0A0W0FIJ0_MONRR
MSLEPGLYFIRNGDRAIGRLPQEDDSLEPKAVYVLPDIVERPNFEIKKIDSDNYTIVALGTPNGPTAQIDNKVYALLEEQDRAEKWRIVHVPQHGENSYIIRTDDQGRSWFAPEGAEQQIRCRPFMPPVPPNEIFEIIRLF